MTGFLLSVIAVVNLLCILVASITLLTKKLTKWLKALKKMITAFHDLWKKQGKQKSQWQLSAGFSDFLVNIICHRFFSGSVHKRSSAMLLFFYLQLYFNSFWVSVQFCFFVFNTYLHFLSYVSQFFMFFLFNIFICLEQTTSVHFSSVYLN